MLAQGETVLGAGNTLRGPAPMRAQLAAATGGLLDSCVPP